MGLRETNRARVRDRILQVCEDLFRSRGFEATSADDIAAAAGISRQTFFNYFPSKDRVLSALALQWLRSQAELTQPGLAGPSAEGWVLPEARRRVLAQARAIEADREFMALVIGRAGPFAEGGEADHAGPGREIFQAVAEVVRRGQAIGEIRSNIDPLRIAEVYVSTMLMTVRLWLLGAWLQGDSLETRLNIAIDILEGGVRVPG